MVDPGADGYQSPEDCPIPVDKTGACDTGGQRYEDEIVDTDDEDAFISGRCMPCPGEPSPQEVARHNLTHLPYRAWCPHCVAARRNNQAHQKGTSAPRSLPLLVLDYCFIRDGDASDNLTVLVGRLYPSRALFATVVTHKGASDTHTVSRLCNFLRASGASSVVYKTDQEKAVVAIIQEAVRVSKLPKEYAGGNQFHGVLTQAVPETSAVGQSASNSRAERSVQQIEDLVRTYKSALESRMGCKLSSDHALMRWIVEHAANVYNKYAVTPEGTTPYAALHGKNPRERLVEFGERILWHVPKALRAKLDLRWRLGVYAGYSPTSNEYFLGLPNGNVVKSRSIVRVVPSGRWDRKSLMAIKGIPGKLTANEADQDVEVEEFERPHANADDQCRDAQSTEVADAAASNNAHPHLGGDEGKEVLDRQIRITMKDLKKYGFSPGCPRCLDLEAGFHQTRRNHSDTCRLRMYSQFYEHNDPKWKAVESQIPRREDSAADQEQVCLDEVDADQKPKDKSPSNQRPAAQDVPRPAPATPLNDEKHFQPPVKVSNAMRESDAMEFAYNQSNGQSVGGGEHQPMDVSDDPPVVDDEVPDCFLPSDDEDMDTVDRMQSALIGAGTDPDAAKYFVEHILGLSNATTFVEMYGQGSIVSEANTKRRSLNLRGLNAFDLRTCKPDGAPWNFNVKEDRHLARRFIKENDPEWIIGSPPCTAFGIWNRQINYRKMDADKVKAAVDEGKRHLRFCAQLYRRQLARGKHFLHEHPARALSWSEPEIAALMKYPLTHLVVADQCAYGLTTPSQIDGSPTLAQKLTRFLTSSVHMARQLQAKCDRSHVHPQLVGGRCKEAAYYPLGLIRAILRGMHDTTMAEHKAKEEEKDTIEMLNALSSKPTRLPEVIDTSVRQSKIPRATGGCVSISYDNWKPRYSDEYTGEVLPHNLVQDAMIDELDYFNEHVWQVDTLDNMKKVPNHILVRS